MKKLVLLALLVNALNIVDMYTTHVLTTYYGYSEWNPLYNYNERIFYVLKPLLVLAYSIGVMDVYKTTSNQLIKRACIAGLVIVLVILLSAVVNNLVILLK